MKSSENVRTPRPARGQRTGPQGPSRTDTQREQDYATIAVMFLSGISKRKIAEHIGVSHSQIRRDIEHVMKGWAKENEMEIRHRKAWKLRELNQVKQSAWKAWHGSREKSHGNVKYLQLVKDTIVEEMHVEGVYAAAAIEHRHSGGVQVNHRLAEADRILEAAYGSAPALPATTSDDDIIIDGVVEPLTVAAEIQ